jgi:hypothetical protein
MEPHYMTLAPMKKSEYPQQAPPAGPRLWDGPSRGR